MSDLVSIITPLYNSEAFIAGTIESVRRQTYRHWEMLIIDDGSADNGPEIVEMVQRQEPRIRLFRLKDNWGGAVARNWGIREAKGRYVAFLDSDDLWHPEKLGEQIRFMQMNHYPFTFTEYDLINEKGDLLNRRICCPETLNYAEQLKYNHLGCLTAIYDACELGKVLMPEIRKRQDYALWLQILKKCGRGYGLQKSLAYYRLRSHSVSANKLELIKWNWRLYREVEQFSRLKSCYYVFHNICAKLAGLKCG
ncbi:nucleotide-diphospho-sugar transferases [Lucifera butyrica]|uniref:Nucleotide-diphospho-sugar transferases n=1 Tax=Lucifera butyrica TaxID=1351585 RepID=A0A498REH5_9FIRM|nr:glycosyltransferase family 2 protein [Lucifera butyrica]VBB09405.1 nucleotide-diphospho-sugar transferases [Lucifera butyrica]